MRWLFPDGFVGDDPSSKRNAKMLGVILLLIALYIAAGVGIMLGDIAFWVLVAIIAWWWFKAAVLR
jgi:hypothetical protein